MHLIPGIYIKTISTELESLYVTRNSTVIFNKDGSKGKIGKNFMCPVGFVLYCRSEAEITLQLRTALNIYELIKFRIARGNNNFIYNFPDYTDLGIDIKEGDWFSLKVKSLSRPSHYAYAKIFWRELR